jgi:type I restriction enzyme S subunit
VNRWSQAPLTSVLSARISDGPHETPEFLDDGVPFLSVDNIVDGHISFDGCRRISLTDHDRYSKKMRPLRGDVLITKAASIGRVALVSTDIEFNVWSPIAVLRPNPALLLGAFLWRLLESSPLQAKIQLAATSNTQQNISMRDLSSLRVPLPPLTAQRAIADYLDAEGARIDALIEKKQRMVELLEKRWRSAAQYRMSDLMSQFGSIQLRHLVRCLDGRRIPVSSEERGTRPGPFPYYGASGIVDSIDGYLFDETLVLLGEDGAQLGDPDYPIAQVVDGKVWVNNHAHVLRPTAVDPEFLTYHLNTFDRVPFMSGGTREKITQDDMNRIPVPHLPKVDQAKEARRLGEIRERCNEMSSLLVLQLDLLAEHRQALITAAVTGALNITGVAA